MTSQKPSDIKIVLLEEEMKKSYLDYAMSVIVARALPDVRDGLKPVHRRILYAMSVNGNDSHKPHKKSANAVGFTMMKFHPHGDAAIYDAMVRLAQDFNLRLPLVDGQGNFGSMDGDPAAASRYTEARLSKPSMYLLEDIDKNTVDFRPNYDETTLEPCVLPARFPNLLVNGANGIAVGMATSIPTHNLGEIIDAACAILDNPDLSFEELLTYVPGPDFPTGATIIGRRGILDAFQTGRGTITIRAKTHIEKLKDREAIVVDEIPYQVNKARMVERIAELVKEKLVEGISDLRDESNRQGVRVVIELKRDANADVILNQLYKFSPLQNNFSFNMLALVHGRPEQLSVKQMLAHFVAFREDVVVRRTRFELDTLRDKAHLLVGFALCVANMDEVIILIRSSLDRKSAKEQLLARTWNCESISSVIRLVNPKLEHCTQYQLDEKQADAILDLRLHRLTAMEQDKIKKDLDDIIANIKDLLDVLSNRPRVLAIVKNEMLEVKTLFATPRRTIIEDNHSHVDMEDLIPQEDMIVTVSVEGYIKRVPLSTYRAQRRGGKGRSGMSMKDEDMISDIFVANTHAPVLFFTSIGRVYALKVYRLPLGSPQSKGRAMVNLLPLSENEKTTTVLVLPRDAMNKDTEQQTSELEPFLIFVTSRGNVRRNRLSDFRSIQSNGKKAMVFDEGEYLVNVRLAFEDDDIMLFTKDGACNRFSVSAIRIFSGRDSNGVRGIKLKSDDHVISMTIIKNKRITIQERAAFIKMARQDLSQEVSLESPQEMITSEGEEAEEITLSKERFEEIKEAQEFILTVTENGFGKRSSAYLYRATNRGTGGYESIKVDERNGAVVAAFPVRDHDHIVLITDNGRLIRCPVHDIRIAGRSTKGVTIFKTDGNEKVVSVSRIDGESVVMTEEDDTTESIE